MGACVSFPCSPPASSASEASDSQRAAAASTVKVVNLDGSMTQLTEPVTAREALAPSDDGGRQRVPSPTRLYLCSSDELGFDAPPRALAAGKALQSGQLYFVLPASPLRRSETNWAASGGGSRRHEWLPFQSP